MSHHGEVDPHHIGVHAEAGRLLGVGGCGEQRLAGMHPVYRQVLTEAVLQLVDVPGHELPAGTAPRR